MIGRLLTGAAGLEGTPILYSPRLDDGVALLFLCSFLLSAYVLARSRKFLALLGKDFVFHRERNSIFATSTGTDMRYLLLLVLQTCVMTALYLFNYFIDVKPELGQWVPSFVLLGSYIIFFLLYVILKWFIYSFLGWIFLDSGRTTIWIGAYFTLLYYLGFSLFLFNLFLVYFDLQPGTTIAIGLFLLFLTKVLMFYKGLKLFCSNLYGCFLLFLYFCALEIMPCFALYRAMIQLNECLIIKF